MFQRCRGGVRERKGHVMLAQLLTHLNLREVFIQGCQISRSIADSDTCGSLERMPTKFRTSEVLGMSFPELLYILLPK